MGFVCPSLRGASQVKNEKLMSWKTHRNRTWNRPDLRSVKTKPCGGNAVFLVANTKFGVLRVLITTRIEDGLTWGIPIKFRSKISLKLIGPLLSVKPKLGERKGLGNSCFLCSKSMDGTVCTFTLVSLRERLQLWPVAQWGCLGHRRTFAWCLA